MNFCLQKSMNIITILFLVFVYLSLKEVQGLKHQQRSHLSLEPTTIEQKLTKIKQFLALIQDSDVNSLLRINSQVFQGKDSGIFQNNFRKQQIDIMMQAKNFLQKWKQCPSQKPFFDGLICVSCKKEQIFDLTTQKCSRCISGTIYDTKKKLCFSRASQVNIALTEMDLQRAQEIIIIRANHIAASLMSFVVEKTQRLKDRLNSENFTENFTNSLHPNVTNPHFLNLILLSNDQIISQFNLGKNDIPCPKQKPFFSKNKCISCNYPTHLFDATTKWCVKCSNNFIYSVKSHKCIKLQKTKD